MVSRKAPTPQEKGQTPQNDKIFREFEGINTQAARQAITPEQFSWLENVMPIGHGNGKVVPAPSGIMASVVGQSVYYQHSYNLNNVPYMFYACVSGNLYQINLETFAVTLIGTIGSFSGVQVAQWSNTILLIISSTDYYSWDGSSLTALGGTTGAPTAGQCIATFAGRVWISQGRTVNYSQPGSYTDFTGTGGNFLITDSTLTSDIQQLLSANNYLYIAGVDSINVVADVQVVSGSTQFSNTNLSANSGTNLPQTMFPYYRSVWYMNTGGIYALYGSTTRKMSDELDGIFQKIDFTQPVTGGTVQIYNILCAAFMFTYNDPLQGPRPIMAVYFNKKWFVASQGGELTLVATANIDGVDVLFANDGVNLYQLFEDMASTIDWQFQTSLWDFGEMVRIKQALKIGVEVILPSAIGTIMPTVDTETSSQAPISSFSGSSEFTWENSAGAPFLWFNSLAQPFVWLTTGYAWLFGDVETDGHYLGVTINSDAPQVQLSGIQLQYRMLPAGWGK